MATPGNWDVANVVPPLVAQPAATLNSPDLSNRGGRGVRVVLDITAIDAATNVTVTIRGKDQSSGKYYTLLASTAKATTGTTVLTVYPGLTAAANVTASDILPATWQVQVAVAGSGSATATVGASVIG